MRDGLRGGAAGLLEEHEVAGGKLVPRDGNAVLQLSGGGAVDGVAELCAGILHKTGAVKADARAGPAIDVAVTDVLERDVRKLLPLARSGGGSVVRLLHIGGADVALLDLIPAALDGHDLHAAALGEGADLGVAGAGAGADVERTLRDADVELFERLLIGGGLGVRRVDVAAADLIPAVLRAEDLDDLALRELVCDRIVGGRTGADVEHVRRDLDVGALTLRGRGAQRADFCRDDRGGFLKQLDVACGDVALHAAELDAVPPVRRGVHDLDLFAARQLIENGGAGARGLAHAQNAAADVHNAGEREGGGGQADRQQQAGSRAAERVAQFHRASSSKSHEKAAQTGRAAERYQRLQFVTIVMIP